MRIPAAQTRMSGRDDSAEAPDAVRLHQRSIPTDDGAELAPGSAVIGFACDAGVVRNHGRPGAAGGPAALRAQLGGLASHLAHPLYDAGDVTCVGDGLEQAQAELSTAIAALIGNGHRPVVLGGGHEAAWGSYLGIRSALHARGEGAEGLAVVNIDAHFDLRSSDRPSSGTPFRQMAGTSLSDGARFHYFCLGVSEAANTAALFRTAEEIGATYLTDMQMQEVPRDLLAEIAHAFEQIYLTVDLDALPSSAMPAVSAPAALGVPPAVVLECVRTLRDSGKLILSEVAELNPAYDIDNRGAGLAARVVYEMIGDGASG
ncbi:MAG: formimidoylglutamase [Actinomycetota bacterium]|nr:formimidoylglutamase [Actinomycetota bacterium]